MLCFKQTAARQEGRPDLFYPERDQVRVQVIQDRDRGFGCFALLGSRSGIFVSNVPEGTYVFCGHVTRLVVLNRLIAETQK